MYTIEARNPQQALPELMHLMEHYGVRRESRNGPVLVLPSPCIIQYNRPQERVVFWSERDANPFFHLFEALWMLAGRCDVAFPASFVPHMVDYSDDGKFMHGAYGYRWRHHFDKDQIYIITDALRENPDCRRQVLSMWDCECDLGCQSKDLPCNTHAYFVRDEEGRLNMTVCNRSNDSVWGALGSNVVHFSMLQEVMAGLIGCPLGKYWQFSNNMHLYLEKHDGLMRTLADKAFPSDQWVNSDPYVSGFVTPMPIFCEDRAAMFLEELNQVLEDYEAMGVTTPFLRRVAIPMREAWKALKTMSAPVKYDCAMAALRRMPDDNDWGIAATEWVVRRREVWKLKQQQP